jgi:hypothetical protein
MKRIYFWGLIGLFIISCSSLFGCSGSESGGNRMVAYGSDEAEDEAGLEVVEPEGEFLAEDYIISGLPTVILFGTKMCPGTKRLKTQFKQFLNLRSDVAVRQIYLPNDWQPDDVREEYQIDVGSVPHIIIYDSDGELVAQDEGRDKKGFEFLYKWMNDEIQKDWKEKQAG